jgi:esterase/lipase
VTLSPPLSASLGFVARRGWPLPDWYVMKLWASDVRDPEARIASYDRNPLRAALEVYRAGRRVEPRLASVTCPTLVLHGKKDRVCPPSNVRLVAERVGAARIETKIYERSAHLVAVDFDRLEVAADVSRFVEQIAQREVEQVAQREPVEP